MSNFADKLASATGRTNLPAGQTAPPPPAPSQPRIRDPRRAGRAPYNFVPLPPGARWVSAPPPADSYSGLSGVLELEITALTDFYIRGTAPWDEYIRHSRKNEKPEVSLPFMIGGKPALPGSSLRGMLRMLVEIIGQSPLDPINDSQLFFRTVGSTSNPGDRNSFEPHAVAYKSRIDPLRLPNNVKAGYLAGHADDSKWTIVPAQSRDGRQFYQVALEPKGFRDDLAKDQVWRRGPKIWFRPGRLPKYAEWSNQPQPGFEEGEMVCSGGIKRKRHQWVIRPADSQAHPVQIPEWDAAAYRDTGVSQAIKKHEFAYSSESNRVPCFYVEWNSPDDGKRHITFSHTYNMRLPYEHSVAQRVPEACRRDAGQWDLAQAIFGRTDDGSTPGHCGRVFLEDAVFVSGPPQPVVSDDWHIVLGAPKPTTFQHYLVQPREDVVNSLHWDGNYQGQGTPSTRGHKLYFHRPGASPTRVTDPRDITKKDNVISTIRPARKDCVLRARVRYENLNVTELGALLAAIDLPAGCAHKIGMAKPGGFGSIRIRIADAKGIDRKTRYERLFADLKDGRGILGSGEHDLSAAVREQARNAFASWVKEGATLEQLWQSPRMDELKALLMYDGLPEDWLSRTRYLEFGVTKDKVQYNEYKHIGYPKLAPNGRPFLEQRRPLPPATQVLTDPNMPNDPRPPFVPRR